MLGYLQSRDLRIVTKHCGILLTNSFTGIWRFNFSPTTNRWFYWKMVPGIHWFVNLARPCLRQKTYQVPFYKEIERLEFNRSAEGPREKAAQSTGSVGESLETPPWEPLYKNRNEYVLRCKTNIRMSVKNIQISEDLERNGSDQFR